MDTDASRNRAPRLLLCPELLPPQITRLGVSRAIVQDKMSLENILTDSEQAVVKEAATGLSNRALSENWQQLDQDAYLSYLYRAKDTVDNGVALHSKDVEICTKLLFRIQLLKGHSPEAEFIRRNIERELSTFVENYPEQQQRDSTLPSKPQAHFLSRILRSRKATETQATAAQTQKRQPVTPLTRSKNTEDKENFARTNASEAGTATRLGHRANLTKLRMKYGCHSGLRDQSRGDKGPTASTPEDRLSYILSPEKKPVLTISSEAWVSGLPDTNTWDTASENSDAESDDNGQNGRDKMNDEGNSDESNMEEDSVFGSDPSDSGDNSDSEDSDDNGDNSDDEDNDDASDNMDDNTHSSDKESDEEDEDSDSDDSDSDDDNKNDIEDNTGENADTQLRIFKPDVLFEFNSTYNDEEDLEEQGAKQWKQCGRRSKRPMHSLTPEQLKEHEDSKTWLSQGSSVPEDLHKRATHSIVKIRPHRKKPKLLVFKFALPPNYNSCEWTAPRQPCNKNNYKNYKAKNFPHQCKYVSGNDKVFLLPGATTILTRIFKNKVRKNEIVAPPATFYLHSLADVDIVALKHGRSQHLCRALGSNGNEYLVTLQSLRGMKAKSRNLFWKGKLPKEWTDAFLKRKSVDGKNGVPFNYYAIPEGCLHQTTPP